LDAQERLLIKKALDGDERAFEALVKPLAPRLLRVLALMLGNAEDASDAWQETMFKVWRSLDSFKGDCKFSSWVFTAGVNTALNLRKSRARFWAAEKMTQSVDEPAGTLVGSAEYAPDETLQNKELFDNIDKAFEALSDDQRAMLAMHVVEGTGYEELARVFNVPKGTVMSRLHSARETLKKNMKDLKG